MTKKQTEDPVEIIIQTALEETGIAFTQEGDKEHPDHCLDFDLTDHNLAIECKWDHTPRSTSQLARQRNIILIQGVHSANFFADALRGHYRRRIKG